jgi:hypothetical protein
MPLTMADPTGPDLMVLGDSHGAALLAGARLLGLSADGLTFSGAAWHEGRFTYGRSGFEPRNAPAVRQQMAALRERMGVANPFESSRPVLTTMGFHLGRLVPPFGWHGHRVASAGEAADADAPGVSAAFLEAYVRHYRDAHIRLAKRIAARAPLVVVAPPPAFDRPNYAAFRETVTRMMRAEKLTVYDPAEDLAGTDGLLDPRHLEEDGIHGTAEYGAAVVTILVKRGLLGPAPAMQHS